MGFHVSRPIHHPAGLWLMDVRKVSISERMLPDERKWSRLIYGCAARKRAGSSLKPRVERKELKLS